MSAIGPGDWVECVDVSDHWDFDEGPEEPVLELGGIYRVHGVCDPADVWGNLDCIELAEFPQVDEDGSRWCFEVSRFRPIYRPRKGSFDHLLLLTPVEVDA